MDRQNSSPGAPSLPTPDDQPALHRQRPARANEHREIRELFRRENHFSSTTEREKSPATLRTEKAPRLGPTGSLFPRPDHPKRRHQNEPTMPAVCDARAGADPRLPSGSETSAADDDASLREALKRCPAATYQAAVRFKKTGDARHLPAIILGIIERFVEPDQRSRLNHSPENLRLVEDLGIDSLTMMEIVMLVEDVLAITINHEDLRGLHTLGQVRRFIEVRLGGDPSTGPA